MWMVGKLEEFDCATDMVSVYVARTQLYFEVNGVNEDKQVAVFLTAIGSKTYALLHNLFTPSQPKDKSLDEIEAKLKTTLRAQTTHILERFHFNKRQQVQGESVSNYVVELRRLSTHYNFGEFLDDVL